MTELAFHFNADDKWVYSCRLLRKAVAKGQRVAVTADEDALERLDRALWTFSELDFVPHCVAGSAALVLDASPVVLCASPDMAPHEQVLLNIGMGVPAGFERFERLIEVVGTDESDRAHARRRWKHYLDRGYAIDRHDIAPRDAR